MVGGRELVAFEDAVEFLVGSGVEGDHSPCLEDTFVLLESVTGRKRPEESSEEFYVSTGQKDLANTGHLLLGKSKGLTSIASARWQVRPIDAAQRMTRRRTLTVQHACLSKCAPELKSPFPDPANL